MHSWFAWNWVTWKKIEQDTRTNALDGSAVKITPLTIWACFSSVKYSQNGTLPLLLRVLDHNNEQRNSRPGALFWQTKKRIFFHHFTVKENARIISHRIIRTFNSVSYTTDEMEIGQKINWKDHCNSKKMFEIWSSSWLLYSMLDNWRTIIRFVCQKKVCKSPELDIFLLHENYFMCYFFNIWGQRMTNEYAVTYLILSYIRNLVTDLTEANKMNA